MYVFEYEITIGKYVFGKKNKTLHSIEINSSWKSIGDTCKLKFGNLKKQLNNAIKVGDEVQVRMGYLGKEMQTEFKGFVAEIQPNQPFEILCKDYVWLLEREYISKSWASTTLKDVLKYVAEYGLQKIKGGKPIISNQVPNIVLAPYRIDKATAAQALKKLRDDYGLVAYFRGQDLYAGLAYGERLNNDDKVKYIINGKYANVAKETNLIFKKKDDLRIKIKAVSFLPNNKKVEAEAGDLDGETRTWISETPINDKNILKARAEREVEKYKYDGFKGDITTFGIPFCVHGQIIELIDFIYSERNGKYFVDSVQTTVSKSNGFKRKVTLGKKAQ
jgi:hypothetical protein